MMRRLPQAAPAGPQVQRLTISGTAPDSPFVADASPFFGSCQDNLMTLHYGGRMGLLDLFPWEVTDEYLKTQKYLTWVRPAYSNGAPTAGYQSDACATPNGYEIGAAEINLTGFGLYGRSGPVRKIAKPERYCEMTPRYRIDGSLVTNEFEWDLAFIMDTIKQDLFRAIITGNDSTAGQFDGLQQWINTGFDGSGLLDSMIVDWNGNNMDGTGGGAITYNGTAITSSPDLVDMLLAIYRRAKQRMMWAPMLATQDLREGQVVLVLPTFLAECLLDKYTCWSVCEGRQYNEVNLQTDAARAKRDTLIGGLFGAGKITLDGDPIHLFAYDWETMHGTHRGDMYFLWMGAGNVKLWQGQHLSAGKAAAQMRTEGHAEYFSSDGDRIIGTKTVANLCKQIAAWMMPRLWCMAPFLQARIMEVECTPVLDPLSPDPLETSFYPATSFAADIATTG